MGGAVLQRIGSTKNAITKDIMAQYGKKWTDSDEERKKEIFGDLLQEGLCDYCGCQIKGRPAKEHFIPTNNSKSHLYGAEHSGNFFTSCRNCNHSKHNHNPLEWMRGKIKTKNKKPYTYNKEERLEKFQKFYDEFSCKLKATPKLVQFIEEMHKKAEKKHAQLNKLILNHDPKRTN